MSPDEPIFKVCAYNAAGRWQPAVAGVPVALRTQGGWVRGGDAAAVAALTAAAGGCSRVVVVDREDASVMELEGRAITYPPEWVATCADVGGLEPLRDVLQVRLLAHVGRTGLLDVGVPEALVAGLPENWIAVAGAELSRAMLEEGVLHALLPASGVLVAGRESPRRVVVAPRVLDAVAYLALRSGDATAIVVPGPLNRDVVATAGGLRRELDKLAGEGVEVLAATPRGPEGSAFLELVRRSVRLTVMVDAAPAAGRRGWFGDLDEQHERARVMAR